MSSYHVVVIGGGGTGAAIIHDLRLRGIEATLVERGELTSGTTGRHHGQLHCGARYAVKDRAIARECMEETYILKRIAAESLEANYGLFVALTEEDEEHAPVFIQSCVESGIPTKEVPVEHALEMEPNLNPEIKRAIMVPDGTIDAWRLPLQFFATAKHNGARVHTFTPVTGFTYSGSNISGVQVYDLKTRQERTIKADLVINATGAWAGQVTKMADVEIPITPGPGTMVAVKKRLNNMVISRLHPVGDGDIIVPQRGLSIIGTTQYKTDDPDDIAVPEDDITEMYRCADMLIPSFSSRKYHAAWIAARPLAGAASSVDDARNLSRDFNVVDHGELDGPDGLLSVIGGKATVLRAMAEQTVDAVCAKFGVTETCRTAETPLLAHRAYFA